MSSTEKRTKPRALPIGCWPSALLQAWQAAQQPPDFLEEARPAATWSPRRRRQVELDAGRYLSWLTSQKRSVSEAVAVQQASSGDALAAFALAEEARGMKLTALVTALGNVVGFVRCIAPDWDPAPAWALVNRVRARAHRLPVAPRAIAHPAALCATGIQRMEAALNVEGDVVDLDGWQDGLMVALLAAVPIRIANFAGLRIGQHLVEVEGGWRIELSEAETKTRRADQWEVPPLLLPYLEHFIRAVRPRLLDRSAAPEDHLGLWIGAYGQQLESQGVRKRIVAVTGGAFPHPILPHSFRHSAATTFALEHPDRPRDAAFLLGHASPRTTERHYTFARRQLAIEELHRLLEQHSRLRHQGVSDADLCT